MSRMFFVRSAGAGLLAMATPLSAAWAGAMPLLLERVRFFFATCRGSLVPPGMVPTLPSSYRPDPFVCHGL